MENNNNNYPVENSQATQPTPVPAAEVTPTSAVDNTAAPAPAAQTTPYQAAAPTMQYTQPQVQPQAAYNPYAPTYGYQPVAAPVSKKRTGGQIAAIIIGIIFTIIGAFTTFCGFVYYLSELFDYGEVYISIPVCLVLLFPLILGIVLLVIGCKKKKNVAPAVSSAMPYAAPQQTAYVQSNGYQAATPATPAAPVATTAVPSAPVQTATPTATDTAASAVSAPVEQTASDTQAATAAVPNTMSYQYAPTAAIQDDSVKAAKKTARNYGLVSIAISLGMWFMIFVLDYVMVGYVTVLPIIFAFTSLKNNIKSVSGWIGMVLSILTGILAIFVYVTCV